MVLLVVSGLSLEASVRDHSATTAYDSKSQADSATGTVPSLTKAAPSTPDSGPSYDVTFAESGVPNPSPGWNLTFSGGPWVHLTTRTTSLSVENGTYPYGVTAPFSSVYYVIGVPAGPNHFYGNVTVNGGAVNVSITFYEQTTVDFHVNQSSVPGPWTVVFRGTSPSTWVFNGTRSLSTTFDQSYSAENGSYEYVVDPPQGYTASPASGNLTVNGGPVTVQEAFKIVPPPCGAPTISLQSPTPTSSTLTVSGSAAPGGSSCTITSISWSWGDGQTSTSFLPASHTYAAGGTYTITATAEQSDGKSAMASVSATIPTMFDVTETGLNVGVIWGVSLQDVELGASTASADPAQNEISVAVPSEWIDETLDLLVLAESGDYTLSYALAPGSPGTLFTNVNGPGEGVEIDIPQGPPVELDVTFVPIPFTVEVSVNTLPSGFSWSALLAPAGVSSPSAIQPLKCVNSLVNYCDYSLPDGNYNFGVVITGTESGSAETTSEPATVLVLGTVQVEGNNEFITVTAYWATFFENQWQSCQLLTGNPNDCVLDASVTFVSQAPDDFAQAEQTLEYYSALCDLALFVLLATDCGGDGLAGPFDIGADSPVNILVTDPDGNIAGYYANGTEVDQIAGAVLLGPCSTTSDQLVSVFVPAPIAGAYRVTLYPACASANGSNYTVYEQSATGTQTYLESSAQGSAALNVTVALPVAYSTIFNESGLPSDTPWCVNATGVAPLCSTSGSATTYLSNGTYHYVVSTENKEWASSGGSFVVNGTLVSMSVIFKPVTYNLTITESGIPTRLLARYGWTVTMAGATHHESNAIFGDSMVNGSYNYLVQGPSGYRLTTSSEQTINVNGANLTVSADFVPHASYSLSFHEVGLQTGTSWCVSILLKVCSTTPTLVFKNMSPGSYEPSVGSFAGMTTLEKVGTDWIRGSALTATLSRGQTIQVRFGYPVTFTETGLPSGWFWSVRSDGEFNQSDSATTVLYLPNGTHGYTVGPETGYTHIETPRTLHVVGGPLSANVTFMARHAAMPSLIPMFANGASVAASLDAVVMAVAAVSGLLALGVALVSIRGGNRR